jgi:ABC-type protease/lipase transport system fused ATPase/permease subunit
LNAARALAVLAAANFVVAFALATLLPPLTTLAQLVARDDPQAQFLYAVRDFLMAHGASWVWSGVVLPLLLRPCWLLSVCIGVICAGGASTLASRASVARSHGRRS